MSVTTPLGADVLLLNGYTGTEQMSGLFHFELELRADKVNMAPKVKFESLLGQPMSIEADVFSESSSDSHRYFNGICSRFSEEGSDKEFVYYRAEIVPKLWLLTRHARSRIFQQKNVPDILKVVLQDIDVQYSIQGTFDPREYCVQYRETDFNFMSRLMEEEGLFYFFNHTQSGHQDGGDGQRAELSRRAGADDDRLRRGGRRRSCEGTHIHRVVENAGNCVRAKYTLWDNCFEFPAGEKSPGAEDQCRIASKSER